MKSPAFYSLNRQCYWKTHSSAGSLSRGFRTTFRSSLLVFVRCWTSAAWHRLTLTASFLLVDRHSSPSCVATSLVPSVPANCAAVKSSPPSPKAWPSAPWKINYRGGPPWPPQRGKTHFPPSDFPAFTPSDCGPYRARLWSVSLVQSPSNLRISRSRQGHQEGPRLVANKAERKSCESISETCVLL